MTRRARSLTPETGLSPRYDPNDLDPGHCGRLRQQIFLLRLDLPVPCTSGKSRLSACGPRYGAEHSVPHRIGSEKLRSFLDGCSEVVKVSGILDEELCRLEVSLHRLCIDRGWRFGHNAP